MLHLSAKCYRSLIWWEDALWKTFWEAIWRTYYSFWFTSWVSSYNCERSVPNPSIWKESFTWIVPRIRSLRGGNLEGWHTGCRPWGVGDDGRIGNLLEKTQCERGDISQRKGEFLFPVADGRIKPPGGDQELRTSTLIRHRPIQGESHIDFLGESEGSLPPPQDSFPDAGEAINDFWAMSGNFIYRHHVEPRVKLYSPRKESFPIPLKYIDVSRTTHTNLDVKQERRIDDYWNIDGSRDLSGSWTGFTQFILMEEKPPDGYMWSGERLTRKQLTSRPDFLWPGLWEKIGKNAKLKERQKWSHEESLLDNAGKLRGIYVIDPEDKELKETIRNARKELETPVAPAMPSKISKNNQNCGNGDKSNKIKIKTCVYFGSQWIYKTAYGRIITESSWRPYCRKRRQFTAALQFGSQVYSYASSHENSRSKGSSGQGMGTIGENSAWNLTIWIQSTKNRKVELYSEATLLKTIQGLMQYSLNKDHQHHKWQQQKSWISFPDCQVAQDKQRTQYLLTPR